MCVGNLKFILPRLFGASEKSGEFLRNLCPRLFWSVPAGKAREIGPLM
jgi:hypothetical protein